MKKNRLIIIGAGGHGKVIADLALKNNYTEICFIDDHATGTCLGLPIIGTSEMLNSFNDSKTDFIIAVGNNHIREKIANTYSLNWVSLIHPSAQIGFGTSIGIGTAVMAGAVINPAASIGNHCIINTCSVVEHDNRLGNFVHISPNAALGGTVSVGNSSHIGIGATVRNNITIEENSVIGAGAVVVKNLATGVYVGVPAKLLY